MNRHFFRLLFSFVIFFSLALAPISASTTPQKGPLIPEEIEIYVELNRPSKTLEYFEKAIKNKKDTLLRACLTDDLIQKKTTDSKEIYNLCWGKNLDISKMIHECKAEFLFASRKAKMEVMFIRHESPNTDIWIIKELSINDPRLKSDSKKRLRNTEYWYGVPYYDFSSQFSDFRKLLSVGNYDNNTSIDNMLGLPVYCIMNNSYLTVIDTTYIQKNFTDIEISEKTLYYLKNIGLYSDNILEDYIYIEFKYIKAGSATIDHPKNGWLISDIGKMSDLIPKKEDPYLHFLVDENRQKADSLKLLEETLASIIKQPPIPDTEIARLEADITRLKNEIGSLTTDTTQKSDKIKDLTTDNNQKAGQIVALAGERDDYKIEAARLKEIASSSHGEKDQIILSLRKEVKSLEDEKEAIESEFKAKKDDLEAQKIFNEDALRANKALNTSIEKKENQGKWPQKYNTLFSIQTLGPAEPQTDYKAHLNDYNGYIIDIGVSRQYKSSASAFDIRFSLKHQEYLRREIGEEELLRKHTADGKGLSVNWKRIFNDYHERYRPYYWVNLNYFLEKHDQLMSIYNLELALGLGWHIRSSWENFWWDLRFGIRMAEPYHVSYEGDTPTYGRPRYFFLSFGVARWDQKSILSRIRHWDWK